MTVIAPEDIRIVGACAETPRGQGIVVFTRDGVPSVCMTEDYTFFRLPAEAGWEEVLQP